MICKYLNDLDEYISACESIIDIVVIRRSVWDTDLEKIIMYRYRLT